MEKDQQFRQDLWDIEEHQRMVEAIVKALCNIEYHLEKLSKLDEEMKHLPSSREHFGRSYRAHLNNDFQYLELREHLNYLHTFGAFFRLYKVLKSRYETEVPAK